MSKSFVELQNFLAPAQNILVAMPNEPNFDQVAAALATFLSLQKAGKQVFVVSSGEMIVEFSHLVGVDKITDKLAGQDLVLTLDVPIENIEKVSSVEEKGKLSLVLQAKPGSPAITKEKVLFSSASATADLILNFGVGKLQDLGKIYEENRSLFSQKPIVNIDNQPQNVAYGQVNIIGNTSLCQTTTLMIQSLNLPIDPDISSNLLLGMEKATRNFQDLTTAETFEAAAFCSRAGAKAENDETTEGKDSSAPTEWLEPKIYKGSTLP